LYFLYVTIMSSIVSRLKRTFEVRNEYNSLFKNICKKNSLLQYIFLHGNIHETLEGITFSCHGRSERSIDADKYDSRHVKYLNISIYCSIYCEIDKNTVLYAVKKIFRLWQFVIIDDFKLENYCLWFRGYFKYKRPLIPYNRVPRKFICGNKFVFIL
jgi:hypothetical protein